MSKAKSTVVKPIDDYEKALVDYRKARLQALYDYRNACQGILGIYASRISELDEFPTRQNE